MNKTDLVEQSYLRSDIPEFRPGDTVKVHVRVVGGESRAGSGVPGVAIRRQNGGLRETFTVRKDLVRRRRRADVPGALAVHREARGREPWQRPPRQALLPPRAAREEGADQGAPADDTKLRRAGGGPRSRPCSRTTRRRDEPDDARDREWDPTTGRSRHRRCHRGVPAAEADADRRRVRRRGGRRRPRPDAVGDRSRRSRTASRRPAPIPSDASGDVEPALRSRAPTDPSRTRALNTTSARATGASSESSDSSRPRRSSSRSSSDVP